MFDKYPTLFVTWRSPTTRKIHPVGRLTYGSESADYEFCYIRSVGTARTEGFVPFVEFPKLDACYRSAKLFPLFANRIMPGSRPDYPRFLEALGLTAQTADPITILARTGGGRETDRIEMFPVPRQNPADSCYATHFLLRAIRYMPVGVEERIARLSEGETLLTLTDFQNEYDPNAMVVRTEDNHLLGYIPAYLTLDLKRLFDECGTIKITVERVNPAPAEIHHRLLCKVVACWPMGFKPYDKEDYKPIGADGN